MPKVSVIVPVYGVEEYIERSARSLFGQTLEDMEYVFVNDCTRDKSMEVLRRVLEEYPEREGQVKIIDSEKNGGQAAARTIGMKAMTGDYMVHCDPDDWLELDAYEKMYNKAIEKNADIVTCLYLSENGRESIRGGVSFDGNALTALVTNQYTFSLWDKLIRSAFIKEFDIYPYPGINFTEDFNVVVRSLSYAGRIASVDEPLYHYDTSRNSSICRSSYVESLVNQAVPNMRQLDEFILRRFAETANPIFNKDLLNNRKFWLKWGLYKRKNFRQWCRIWPESHREIKKLTTIDRNFRLFLRMFCTSPRLLSLIYKIKS